MNTVRKTISMPEKVHEAAKRQMEQYGYGEFSDYIQALIRADTGVQPGAQSHAYNETPAPYKTNVSSTQQAENEQAVLKTIESAVRKPRRKKKAAASHEG